jgi:hypothetical protein
MLPDDVVAKIVSYMPEGDTKDVFDERVLAAALQQHRERIRDRVNDIYGARTVIQMLNDAIRVPEDWLGVPRLEIHGYHKWISYEYLDYPMSNNTLSQEELKLKSLYPRIKEFCSAAPVRMQSRLIHSNHPNKGYSIGILWPFLGITLSIEEDICVEPDVDTEISRTYKWKKTFQSGWCSLGMDEEHEQYPEKYELLLACSKNVETDAFVCFIETVLSIFPDSSMPKWKVVCVCGITKAQLQPYTQRLWTYGIEFV